MQHIRKIDERDYYIHYLNQGFSDFSKFKADSFVTLISLDKKDWGLLKTKEFSKQILDFGAVYVVCCGTAAEEIHDTFDSVIAENPIFQSKADPILTTWHDDESIEDILFYLVYLTLLDFVSPKNTIMIFSNKSKQSDEFVSFLMNWK